MENTLLKSENNKLKQTIEELMFNVKKKETGLEINFNKSISKE